jgi:hypothetical protein
MVLRRGPGFELRVGRRRRFLLAAARRRPAQARHGWGGPAQQRPHPRTGQVRRARWKCAAKVETGRGVSSGDDSCCSVQRLRICILNYLSAARSITVGLDASTAAEICRYIVTELAHRGGATVAIALQVRGSRILKGALITGAGPWFLLHLTRHRPALLCRRPRRTRSRSLTTCYSWRTGTR